MICKLDEYGAIRLCDKIIKVKRKTLITLSQPVNYAWNEL